MNISQILKIQIAWPAVRDKIEAAARALLNSGKNSAVVAEIVANVKQAASDAITTADTAAGPLLAVGAEIVEGAFDKAAAAYIGPTATGLISPAVHDGVDKIAATLKAAIDAKALEWKAKLAPVPQTPTAPGS